jgi:hypothetical protein
VDELQMGAYLDGKLALKDLFPPPPTPLERAVKMEASGHWSEAAIALARELEWELGERGRTLTPAAWVRQLDLLEERIRAEYKTVWERLMADEELP